VQFQSEAVDRNSQRLHELLDVIQPYLLGYKLNHRPESVLFFTGRLAQVKKALGNVVLSDLTDERIRSYVRQRQGDGVSGRTINMEVGELSWAIGQPWSLLWPKVRKMEERKDVGRALSTAEQKAPLDGLLNRRTPHLGTLIPLLLLTGMRADAGVSCGLHDLRHTFATRLAENGVSESTMLALMGQMSRAMLERYSHIRIAAKGEAVAGIRLREQTETTPQNSEVVPVKVPVAVTPATIQ
jgi:integrase